MNNPLDPERTEYMREALKEAATYVTRSNDEDGVAFALDEYLGVL